MKATGLWNDEIFLRNVMPLEEERGHTYPRTSIEPRWFRSPNVIPIERHERFRGRNGNGDASRANGRAAPDPQKAPRP